ncbi:ester cyclase [Amnibacterium sp. CER49]|uniref:ester cyclase n=1 Tax=Amnibacterium sp. CER49 TaxID=3039161 RepID=UPI00244AFA17|nr:ester cyclase [Amnibacterium sp. CER49]MDH2442751.1 ester cyclase [Amnibacterium sp. CER49]
MTDAKPRSEMNLAAQTRMGEIVAAKDFDRLDEVLADDFTDHDPAPDQPGGWRGIGAFWQQFGDAFSDVELHPVVVEATDQYVTAVFDVTGTHTGDFLGHPPTGRSFRVRGIQVGRFGADGRMTDRYGSTDQLGMLQQLGLA